MTKYNYVYRITNTKENKHYYGVRSSKVEPKLDLGIKYFSSSSDREFIKDQKENKSIFKYKIIKQYDSRKEAVKLEIKLHSKFNVGANESFYNRAKQTSTGFDTTGSTKTHSQSTIEKIRLNKLANNPFKGKHHTEETKMLLSLQRKGKPQQGGVKFHTEETKQKMRDNCRDVTGANNPCYGRRENNPNAKTIHIFDNNNTLMFKCVGNFKITCELNKLPGGPLTSSYQKGGTPIMTSKTAQTRAVKNKNDIYIGWYAKIIV